MKIAVAPLPIKFLIFSKELISEENVYSYYCHTIPYYYACSILFMRNSNVKVKYVGKSLFKSKSRAAQKDIISISYDYYNHIKHVAGLTRIDKNELASLESSLIQEIKCEKFDKYIAWNKVNFIASVFKKFGDEVVILENGIYRPDYVLVSDDLNIDSSFYSNEGIQITKPSRGNTYRRFRKITIYMYLLIYRVIKLLVKFLPNLSQIHRIHMISGKRFRINKTVKSYNNLNTLPKKFIFVPLQLIEDTQSLLYSNYRCHLEVLNEVVNIRDRIFKEFEVHLEIVVKDHPLEANIKHSATRDYHVSNLDTDFLISMSDLVILVNSSTAVHALEVNKPVITLGDSIYNVEGVIKKVTKLDYKSIFNASNYNDFISQFNSVKYEKFKSGLMSHHYFFNDIEYDERWISVWKE